jgi:protein SCO1/2
MSLFNQSLQLQKWERRLVWYDKNVSLSERKSDDMQPSKLVIMLSVFMIILAACGQVQEIENPLNWEIMPFEAINHEGQKVTLEDLKGEAWVAYFMFTNCDTVCPMLTFHMAELQEKLKDAGVEDIRFVAFSVDPDYDTPEILKAYGSQFISDFSQWHMLTGYSFDTVKDFARENFKAVVQEIPDSDQVMHGTRFYLVDQHGVVQKLYTGLQDIPFEEIIQDAKILVK